jgi:hypothetical protein
MGDYVLADEATDTKVDVYVSEPSLTLLPEGVQSTGFIDVTI